MTHDEGSVPTFPGSWLLGSARALQRDQLRAYTEAMRDHGDHVRFRIGPPRIGFTYDTVFRPEGARQILASRTHRYVKDAPVFTEFAALFGDGLATSEGERWRRHRRILQPLFTRQHVGASVPEIALASANVVARWRTAHPDGGVVDLDEASIRYALEALGRTMFGGEDVDAAVPVLRRWLPVMNDHASRRGLAPVRTPRSWPTPANRRAAAARRAVYGLVDELIRRRQGDPGGEDLLSLLLAARDPETGEGLDDDDIRDEVLVFLVAGHDTTGTALAMTLHLIGCHDDVQDRIRDEVGRVIADRVPTAADLEQLTYTTQVVDESLRLYPPIHTLVRRSVDGGELLGCPLPPERVVAASIWGIQRNPHVWPDPDRFQPQRFDPAVAEDRDRHAHLPFGAGPRSCIGVHLALAELVVAVATVVRAYRLRSLDDEPTVEAGLTLRPSGPLRCRLSPAG